MQHIAAGGPISRCNLRSMGHQSHWGYLTGVSNSTAALTAFAWRPTAAMSGCRATPAADCVKYRHHWGSILGIALGIARCRAASGVLTKSPHLSRPSVVSWSTQVGTNRSRLLLLTLHNNPPTPLPLSPATGMSCPMTSACCGSSSTATAPSPGSATPSLTSSW
jgi:hypothetical protein